MFEDRRDAGQELAKELERYKGEGVLALAIPRGGVEVGYQVAKHLGADFSLLITRKLPYPDQPEAGFGAVAADGSAVILDRATRWLSDETIEQVVEQQRQEIVRRMAVLRKGEPLPDVEGRTVILVDDGLATGATTRAAVSALREHEPEGVVVAVPTAPLETCADFEDLVDEIICGTTPRPFLGVGGAYQEFSQTTNGEVRELLEKAG